MPRVPRPDISSIAILLPAMLLTGSVAVAQTSQQPPCVTCPRTTAAGETPSATMPDPPSIDRWLDVQAATFGLKYRDIENSRGERTVNQLQYQTLVRAAFRIDTRGRYLLGTSLGTGTSAQASWDTTGLGTGDRVSTHSVKELFVAASPLGGVVLQAGSMGFLRGQTTEAIGYDNDFYMMGERVTLRRPADLYFDEISVTMSYVGDTTRPSVFDRVDRVTDSNYRQVLVGRQLTRRVQASADFTSLSGSGTVREGVRITTPELRIVDWIRCEMYQGTSGGHAFGYAVHTEKVMSRALALGGGFADIDAAYGTFNADRFGKGRRGFGYAAFSLPADLSFQVWLGHGVANDFPVANNTRLDLTLTYNLLGTLRRAHALGSVAVK